MFGPSLHGRGIGCQPVPEDSYRKGARSRRFDGDAVTMICRGIDRGFGQDLFRASPVQDQACAGGRVAHQCELPRHRQMDRSDRIANPEKSLSLFKGHSSGIVKQRCNLQQHDRNHMHPSALMP